MPDEVTLEVTQVTESVTVETTDGDTVEINVVATQGATGPAGPNSVTSATTSDGTANLSVADLEVSGGEIYTQGDNASIYTQNTGSRIYTQGNFGEIYTSGSNASIGTYGEASPIYTEGSDSTIFTVGLNAAIATQGDNATISTIGSAATISTAGASAHIETSHANAAVKSSNFLPVESTGASLRNGSYESCLTWGESGRNLTVPSGCDFTVAGATEINTTAISYGTGAAAAHRTALGITQPHIAKMYRRTPLAIGANVFPPNKIALDRTDADTEGTMSDLANGVIRIRRAGWYNVIASASLKNVATAIPRVVLSVRLFSGAGVYSRQILSCEDAQYLGYRAVVKNSVNWLNVGDRLELGIYQNAATAISVEEETADYQPMMTVVELSPSPLEPVVPLRSRRVVAVGDSNTLGGSVCDPARVWGEYLTSDFVNLAVAGQTVATIAGNTSNITANANAASDFILAAGINDLGYSGSPNITTITSNIASIFSVAAPLYRKIIWIAPAVANFPTYAGNATINANIQSLITSVIAAAIPNLIIVRPDQHAKLGASANDPIYYVDGLHYSPIAHAIIADLAHGLITP